MRGGEASIPGAKKPACCVPGSLAKSIEVPPADSLTYHIPSISTRDLDYYLISSIQVEQH
jgi:hypothetical protein